jgi:hypothetical protein
MWQKVMKFISIKSADVHVWIKHQYYNNKPVQDTENGKYYENNVPNNSSICVITLFLGITSLRSRTAYARYSTAGLHTAKKDAYVHF